MEAPSVRRNIAVLAICQALFNSTLTIQVTLGGLVGYALATDKALATVPVTMVVAGTAVTTFPASFLMREIGRRGGFMVGGALGLAGSVLCCYAIYTASFWLFCLGASLFGAYSSFAQYYRFAAADSAPEGFRSRAISYVLAGGLVAGFAGPEIAKHTRELFAPTLFLGTYLASGVLCLAAVLMQTLLDIPRPTWAERRGVGRPLATIARQPAFLVAMVSAAVGYAIMNYIMTATPLAMAACEHPFDSAATVIQWHVVGMFAPSFFTGALIARFGVLNVILAGIVINIASVAVALAGITVAHFWVSLVLLGLGWNFMFIGGTSLLTQTYTPAERAKTQAANDFLVFGGMAVASFFSGKLLYNFGWDTVLWTALPFAVVAGLVTLAYALARPPVRAA